MSENVDSSESAVVENASGPPAEPAEPAQPELASPPKKGDKKKMWITVVAIIVVAALIGSALYVLVIAKPDLSAEIAPDPIPDIGAGTTISLSVIVKSDNDNVTGDADLTWSVSPSTLGSFDVTRQPTVRFTAGDVGGSGTVSCEAEYDGETVVVDSPITVEPPFLDSVSIVPSAMSLDLNEEWTFNATAYDSVGGPVTDASLAWTVTGMDSADYTLSATTGSSVTFSASVEGVANLTATATKGTEEASGTAMVNVGLTFTRSVDYYWDDMFNHPLGDWYEMRAIGSNEWIINNEYPYLYIWEGPPNGNIWVYTFMRMDMVAENLPEVNMNDNPEFLPYFSETARGGTATLDWHIDYVTYEEAEETCTAAQMSWYDGWFVEWSGTVLLDEDAAKAVLGLTSTEFDTFSDWWTNNADEVTVAWEAWMLHEAGPERLAIFNMYEWDLQFMYFDMQAEKSDADHVLLTFDTVSWGMEALMTRWMHEAWMPTEWYFEDMTFQATIGPERADVYTDAAVQYSTYAYEDTPDSAPCWCWEALMEDYVPAPSDAYPPSLFELYEPFTYLNWAPGSTWYGEDMAYDYSPGAWNLTENETLTIEWPAGPQIFFKHEPGYEGETLWPDTRQFYDEMTVRYAEPMPSDTDIVEIDTDARQITYTGPFDMWTWSKDQTAHEWLESEWDRLEILPYGIPFIEIVGATEDEGYDLDIEGPTGPVSVGEPATFTVTAVTSISRDLAEDYAGTVTFESDDGTAVLPANYEFVPATDAGVHEFTVTFNTVDSEAHQATYFVTVTDVSDSEATGTVSGIQVVEWPAIAAFDVAFSGDPVIAAEPTDVTVTAMNQWDEVYTGYVGTVNFTSDDTGATLPADTAFTSEMDGVQTFSVTFSTDGTFEVNVSDVADSEAYGVASTDVLPEAVPHHFVLTGVSEPAEVDILETMIVTIMDQYDRPCLDYDGTVTFETNRTGDVTLPSDTPFSLGTEYVDVDLTFHVATPVVGTYYTIWANDTSDPSITGSLEAWVVAEVTMDHFEVSGIIDMWENNYSDVTVTAIDNMGTVFEDYDGTVTFDSNATSGGDTLPSDYTFVPATDNGVKTFPMAVSFDLPNTYNVTVEEVGDPTINGSQEDIVIEALYLDSLTMETVGGDDTFEQDELFSVRVTAYHQYDEVYEEYAGTVEFATSDGSGLEQLPASYEFQPIDDEGVHQFDDLSLNELGTQTVTATDNGAAISAVLTLEVIEPILSDITWKVYDMFGETPKEWWDIRWDSTWNTEAFLTTDAGNVTYLYNSEGGGEPNGMRDQGLIYAPYRWNVEGVFLPNMNVHDPVFMYTVDSGPVPGSEVSMDIYCQYANTDEWTNYFEPTWSSNIDWDDSYDVGYLSSNDGYITMNLMNVTMNREAAEEWMGMPQGDDPDDWWAANRDSYKADWMAWIDDQGNNVYDIYCGYEYFYDELITMMDMTSDGSEVTLNIVHVTWGYEVLLTRWTLATELSVNQPYMEDIKVVIDYRESDVDFELDGVAQWGMHAVKANETTGNDCAWVWEPIGIDYIGSMTQHPMSYYDPYLDLTYQSWNVGDPGLGSEIYYEACPWAFTLPEYGKLVIELPDYDVVGYYADDVPADAMADVWDDDQSVYDGLRYTGDMSLGWYDLNTCTNWEFADKVLTINGPYEFTNDVRDDGTLYHGAPWIEFNVATPGKVVAASSAPSAIGVVAEEPAAASAPSSVSASTSIVAEMVALMGMAFAVLIAIAALAVGVVRRPEAC